MGPSDTPDDLLIGDILDGDAGGCLETQHMPDARALRREALRRHKRVKQRQALTQVVGEPPAPGESVHIVSEARFDFWTWVPAMIHWLGRTRALYCSTWTLSRPNAVELFELWDRGEIGVAHFLTGLYFKRRETAVYTFLLKGIRARGGRYRCFRNHAKVLLLDAPDRDTWLTVEGSANLTSNPRLEQYVLTNDRELYEFHREWMEEAFAKYKDPE